MLGFQSGTALTMVNVGKPVAYFKVLCTFFKPFQMKTYLVFHARFEYYLHHKVERFTPASTPMSKKASL